MFQVISLTCDYAVFFWLIQRINRQKPQLFKIDTSQSLSATRGGARDSGLSGYWLKVTLLASLRRLVPARALRTAESRTKVEHSLFSMLMA